MGGASANTLCQDIETERQAAGLSLTTPPTEWSRVYGTLSWNRDNLEGYFLRSNRRRFEDVTSLANSLFFAIQDRSQCSVDTFMFSLGGDWELSDELRLDGTHTFSLSTGGTARGFIGYELPEVDGRIDNTVHTIALGMEREPCKGMALLPPCCSLGRSMLGLGAGAPCRAGWPTGRRGAGPGGGG